ncbi:MAG: hypothetical protein JSW01_02460 [Candidatus Bathyarchaeota archaeon]|nr:MAG: hypothetical protein JSW01_02460 [Candidatus Bathyarchaeota archaeon]
MVEKRVLTDVPRIGWGKGIECTFIGALDAALRFLGESVDYVYLMGISGAAFRLLFHQPEWCPSSPDAALNEAYPRQVMKSVGYGGRFFSKEKKSREEMIQIIHGEIDKGRPVVAIDLVRHPDWGIITGYKDNVLFCRTYYDKSEEYSVAENLPFLIFTFEKVSLPLRRFDAILGSFRLSVDLAYKENIDDYTNGIAAYDAWIEDLKKDRWFDKMDKDTFKFHWHVNGWTYDSLYDARLAAVRYLQRIETEFSGKEKETVRKACEKLGQMERMLFENWIYFPMPFWVDMKEKGKTWIPRDRSIDGNTWTRQMRRKGADLLKELKDTEIEVFELLSRLA